MSVWLFWNSLFHEIMLLVVFFFFFLMLHFGKLKKLAWPGLCELSCCLSLQDPPTDHADLSESLPCSPAELSLSQENGDPSLIESAHLSLELGWDPSVLTEADTLGIDLFYPPLQMRKWGHRTVSSVLTMWLPGRGIEEMWT